MAGGLWIGLAVIVLLAVLFHRELAEQGHTNPSSGRSSESSEKRRARLSPSLPDEASIWMFPLGTTVAQTLSLEVCPSLKIPVRGDDASLASCSAARGSHLELGRRVKRGRDSAEQAAPIAGRTRSWQEGNVAAWWSWAAGTSEGGGRLMALAILHQLAEARSRASSGVALPHSRLGLVPAHQSKMVKRPPTRSKSGCWGAQVEGFSLASSSMPHLCSPAGEGGGAHTTTWEYEVRTGNYVMYYFNIASRLG